MENYRGFGMALFSISLTNRCSASIPSCLTVDVSVSGEKTRLALIDENDAGGVAARAAAAAELSMACVASGDRPPTVMGIEGATEGLNRTGDL